MVNKDNAALLLGIGAIVVTLGVGTCSTNARIDDMNQRMTDGFANTNQRMTDGFANVNQRFDDMNQRTTDGFANLQRQIDELQTDVRELRSMQFEALKSEPPAN